MEVLNRKLDRAVEASKIKPDAKLKIMQNNEKLVAVNERIDEAMNYAYGWSDSTVAFMANWGTIMFVISVVPLSLMLEKRYL